MRIEKTMHVIGLAMIVGLSTLAGCGHESAASPVTEAKLSDPVAAETSPAPETKETPSPVTPITAPAASSEPREPVQPAAAATPPATPPAAQRPRADRGSVRAGDAEKITFEDLNLGMQADMVYRDFMLSDRVKDLEGRRVSLAGYMHAGQSAQRGIKKFILLKNTQCKFGPGGQADHLTDVVLREGATTKFTPSDVKIEGIFRIEPFQGTDGNTWSIYRLEDAQIR
jgi:hypothetical protein